jgi:uncharacterized protein
MTSATIAALYRYPVKGLTPEKLGAVHLERGATFPHDRAFAVENGPSGFDPDDPRWLPKVKFLCWMKNPKVAQLDARFDDASGVLAIRSGSGAAEGDLRTDEGRGAIEAFLSDFMGDEQRGPLHVLSAPDHSFSDVARKVVSFINLASAADLGNLLGALVDPLRFRGNVHLDGLDPWVEAQWIGRRFRLGEAEFKAVKPIQRCLATHVDPNRGVRDLDIMGTIRDSRGDLDCGIYAEVITAGTIRPGDRLEFVD